MMDGVSISTFLPMIKQQINLIRPSPSQPLLTAGAFTAGLRQSHKVQRYTTRWGCPRRPSGCHIPTVLHPLTFLMSGIPQGKWPDTPSPLV